MNKKELGCIVEIIVRKVLNEVDLNQTIKNPETGNDIKLSSALAYGKDSKVYKLAKAILSKNNPITKKSSENKFSAKSYAEVEHAFKKTFPVVKDLQSIKKPGVHVDDIQEEFNEYMNKKNSKLTTKNGYSNSKIPGAPYNDYSVTPDNKYGLYRFGANMGIPTLKIGTKSQAEWEEVKNICKVKVC